MVHTSKEEKTKEKKEKKILGIKVHQSDNKTISLAQQAYIERLHQKFCPNATTPISSPMQPNIPLQKNNEPDLNSPYREIVGALIYIALATRPDISFAVSTLCRFLHCYGEEHYKAAIQIRKYLVGSKELGLIFRKQGTSITMQAFSDASFASDINTRRSVTDAIIFINGCAVIWISQLLRGSTLYIYLCCTKP